MPHAVLLIGPPGVGKRALAAWMATHRLGSGETPALPGYPLEIPEYADLRWISPPEDKESILIDQVRELVADINLTSYEGRGKVAVIEPANAMTTNAANSLLKTLEEPPGDALIVLVADRLQHLPATILSRCQRIDMAPPGEAEGLAWLDRFRPGTSWAEALRAAGYAPLAAIDAAELLATAREMGRAMTDIARGSQSPVEVAAEWARLEPRYVLDWLSRQVKLATIATFAGRDRAAGLTIEQSVLERIDRQNLFCYLDIINRLRGQPKGSFNVQLTFESLLIDWSQGLVQPALEEPAAGMRRLTGAR